MAGCIDDITASNIDCAVADSFILVAVIIKYHISRLQLRTLDFFAAGCKVYSAWLLTFTPAFRMAFLAKVEQSIPYFKELPPKTNFVPM